MPSRRAAAAALAATLLLARPAWIGSPAWIGLPAWIDWIDRPSVAIAAAAGLGPGATAEATWSIDWRAGQLLARGLGIADRHAPRPEVAQTAARQRAIRDATEQLLIAARQVPMAGGKPVGELLDAAALTAAVAAAAVVHAEPLVDGSWRVQVALPLETLRQAVHGPRPAPDGGDRGAPILVVHAPATVTPQLGVAVGDGKQRWRGAVLWAQRLAELPLPVAALAKAVTVKALSSDGEELRIPKVAGVTDATLFVVVLGQ